MLIHPTLEGLSALKLIGMRKALEAQMQTPEAMKLDFDERFGMLVDHEQAYRNNKRLANRLRKAQLRQMACVEDLDMKTQRGLDRSVIANLATCAWIPKHQNVIIEGATGTGKSYLSCALAEKACREDFSVLYYRTSRLFESTAIAKIEGRFQKLLNTLAKADLVVLDDFAITPFTIEQGRDLLEILEDRYDRRSTIVSGQLPTDNWHDAIGDPTIADAILDRLVHNAHKIKLKGPSKRANKGTKEEKGDS
ncbi:MAG: IS21-like element helper ATPase IstB [Nitrososphaera sp.]|nr:IS21-like element helper ATPase IstB [Nitrososphaera sp.]